jgi:DnaJ like chaperone protein
MGWWGKLVGGAFGFALGGPLGALLGAALGHSFDKGLKGTREIGLEPGDRERVQTAFFTATFAVMGHVAKADGRVSRDEIRLAEAVMGQMDLGPELRRTAIDLFNQGKQTGFPLDAVLDQFRRECHRRHTLIQMFLEIQIQAALADGALDRSEETLLRHICRHLGVPEFVFRRITDRLRAEQHFGGGRAGHHEAPAAPTLADAHAVLGVAEGDDPDTIKKAYRRLMSQHHPDKLVSKGLPEEMMRIAAQKTREIRQAYEQIREARGF